MWLVVIGPDGSTQAEIALDQEVLDDLPGKLFGRLPDGRYIVQLQEPGEDTRRTIMDVQIRNGRPTDNVGAPPVRNVPRPQQGAEATEAADEVQRAPEGQAGYGQATLEIPADGEVKAALVVP